MVKLQKVWVGVGDNATTLHIILSPYFFIYTVLESPSLESIVQYFTSNGWQSDHHTTEQDGKIVRWYGFFPKPKSRQSKYKQMRLL